MAFLKDRRVVVAFAVFALLALSAVPRPGNADEGDAGAASADEGVGSAGVESHKEKAPREGAQKFEFQAEVNRLMDIIINSLYSNKDIFLRELISNASDALDKLRFLSVTDPDQLGEGENAKLEIKISLDKERKVLMLRDRGVGMTRQDLINNLGTIAKSGTSSFLEQMQKGGDMNLIGQFGVGFYSVYLVADYIEVISKHNDDVQYIWESKADGNFAISEDHESEPLGRGTQINIYLKDEAQEYANEDKLRSLVEKYSEFINFPIYMYASKEVQEEVEIDEEEGEGDDEGEGDEDESEEGDEGEGDDEEGDVEDEEEEEDDGVQTKTVTKTVWEWELLNDNSAIWLRNPSEVEDEEYEKFYKSIAKDDYGKPLSWTHFKAEGDVEFRSVLFIPETAPHGLYDNYWSSAASLKLYVRRVFISDEFEDLVPRYLNFLKGLVDSDTLPLNVSREMLQQHSSLKTIKKKLVRKALDMLRKLAAAEEKAEEEDEGDEEGEGEGEDDGAAGKYKKFWGQFGKSIKLGIIEDTANRQRLAKLLRVQTSRSGDEFISLDKYVEGMKEGQKNIYYIAGQSLEEVQRSPFLEKLLKKGYEVIYFTDALDEYVMQQLTEYDDLKFQNASKENLKMSDKDSKERKREKALKEEYKPLTKWWKDILGSDVDAVKVSNRLTSTPCVVVTGQYGWSANMERIVMSQALGDAEKQAYMKGRRSLEINPNHPMISTLKVRMEEDPDAMNTKDMASLMYETALLESGFQVQEPQAFADMVHKVLKAQMGLDPDAEAVEDEEQEEEEEEKLQLIEAAPEA
uniref:Histidine kinase/HSP90-like ATPase domain-containing protein n=1 Tax=Tetraselmis chuii TaxID=63592 RepID=A0A7S1WYH7_9CHLO|mmetsp:Transcript_11412/g.20645  ORF Transcript_11412/g.20645 Transcript_11412/m.20645 type:complete len:802 (+) Transcript_11412:149-2554(+)